MSSLLDALETAVREHERIAQAIARVEDRLERKVQAQRMISQQAAFEVGEMRRTLAVLKDDLVTAATRVAEIKAQACDE